MPRDKIHTVKRADSLYLIAQRYGLSTRSLIAANKLQPPYRLFVGQRLSLPRPRMHKVARGDTVYAISRRYDVAMSQLVHINGLRPPYTIIVGKTLRLPSAVEADRPQLARKSTEAGANSSREQKALKGGKAAKQVKTARRRMRNQKLPPTRGSFIWPLRGRVISRFGAKGKGLHNDGINLAAPRGTPVQAAQAGVVAYAGNELRGFGKLVLIRHKKGIMSAYAHNDALLVRSGDTVRRGQPIAKVGSTGSVGEPQLHFEIRSGRDAVNPVRFLGRMSAQLSER
ncbi:MAG: M23 family metallopeptidase [Rhodospirillaceae bacterium]|nr:M23 family metallopeptidase [Rhodospirillaceae bacterium]